MATNNSRLARRQAEKDRAILEDDYNNRFSGLFHNSVTIEDNDENVLPKRYLLDVLLKKGAIAYDKQTQLYLPFVESGIDVYGLPKKYNLIGYNGMNFWRSPDEVVILRSNDQKYPIQNYLDIQISKIVDFDMSILQNLEACKTMTIAECKDEKALLTLTNIIESRRIGCTYAFTSKSAKLEDCVKLSSTGATYLVDQLMQARKEIFNETLSTLGIATANTDKRERVQNSEISASFGYAYACIDTLIDTFNHDAKNGGLSIRLSGNTALLDERDRLTDELENKEQDINADEL